MQCRKIASEYEYMGFFEEIAQIGNLLDSERLAVIVSLELVEHRIGGKIRCSSFRTSLSAGIGE